MTKLYIRGLNIFVVLSQIMNVVGVYEKHFFVVVFYVLKELNRYKIWKGKFFCYPVISLLLLFSNR